MTNKKRTSLAEYISLGVYSILRKTPNAPHALGWASVWELKFSQFQWLVTKLAEEFKEDGNSNNGKTKNTNRNSRR